MMGRSLIYVCFASLVMGAASSVTAEPTQAQVDSGKEIAFGRTDGNCLACHQMDDGKLAGNIGPELVDMKSRFPDRDLLFKRIWDETQFNPVTVMPPFGKHLIISEEQINRVVDYLYTL